MPDKLPDELIELPEELPWRQIYVAEAESPSAFEIRYLQRQEEIDEINSLWVSALAQIEQLQRERDAAIKELGIWAGKTGKAEAERDEALAAQKAAEKQVKIWAGRCSRMVTNEINFRNDHIVLEAKVAELEKTSKELEIVLEDVKCERDSIKYKNALFLDSNGGANYENGMWEDFYTWEFLMDDCGDFEWLEFVPTLAPKEEGTK
jgi:hypothetical protein